MNEFGLMLRHFRLRTRDTQTGRPFSQEQLANYVAEKLGMDSLSGATISNWERGRYQIHKDDRPTLTALLQVLHKYGGIQSAIEATQWLEAGNYRPLDVNEQQFIDVQWGEDNLPIADLSAAEIFLPPPTYTRFLGQEIAVQALQQQLIASQGPGVVFICGLGGIGKTSLADVVARRIMVGNWFVRVIWIPAGSFAAHLESAEAVSLLPTILAGVLALPPATESEPLRRLAQIRYLLNTQPHLIVLDDLPLEVSSVGFVDQLHALSGRSRFLITGRIQPPPEANFYLYSMKALAQQDALQLLRHYASMSGTELLTTDIEEMLIDICQVVGGHPLALRLAARLAMSHSWDWLIVGWQRDQQGQIARLYLNIYARLWQTLTEAERQLLIAMLLAAQTGARSEHLQAITGLVETVFWPAVTALVEKSLLEPRGTLQQRRYGIHQLTYQFLQNRLHYSDVDQAWHTKNILANLHYWYTLTTNFPGVEWHFPAEERYNIYQAIAASLALPLKEQVSSVKSLWLALARCLFAFCQQCGYWHEWLPLLRQLVSANEGVDQVELLNQLGVLYQLAHQLSDALVVHEEALALTIRLEDEQGIGHAVANLGRVYYRQRKFAAAAEQVTQALRIFAQQEPEGREMASTLELLGLVMRAQGDYEQGVKHLSKSVQHWRKLNRPVELARALNNLGNTWQAYGDSEAALRYFLEAKIALTGVDSKLDEVMLALSEGTIYFEKGDVAQAGAVFRAIDLAFLRRIGHVLYLGISLNNLGNVCLAEKDYENAETLLSQAVEVWQAASETLQLANSLKTLGDVFRVRCRQENAREAYEEAAVLLQQYPNDLWARKLTQKLEDLRNQLSDG